MPEQEKLGGRRQICYVLGLGNQPGRGGVALGPPTHLSPLLSGPTKRCRETGQLGPCGAREIKVRVWPGGAARVVVDDQPLGTGHET